MLLIKQFALNFEIDEPFLKFAPVTTPLFVQVVKDFVGCRQFALVYAVALGCNLNVLVIWIDRKTGNSAQYYQLAGKQFEFGIGINGDRAFPELCA